MDVAVMLLLAIAGAGLAVLALLAAYVHPKLGALAGIWLGVTGFLLAGWMLRGMPHGYVWHAGIAALALGALLWGAARRAGAGRFAAIGFGIATLAITGWSAVIYPQGLRNRAEALAAGRPYCIAAQGDGVFVNGMSDLTFLTVDKGSNRSILTQIVHGAPAALRLIVQTGTPQPSALSQVAMGDTAPTHLSDMTVHGIPLSPFGAWETVDPVRDLAFQCVPLADDLRAPRTPGLRGFATVLGDLMIPDTLQPGRGVFPPTDLQPTVALAARLPDFPDVAGLAVFIAPPDFILSFSQAEVALMPDAAIETMPSGLVRVDQGISPVMHFHFAPDGGTATRIMCHDATGTRPAVCAHTFLKPTTAGTARIGFTLRYPPDTLPQWAAMEAAVLAQTTGITIKE